MPAKLITTLKNIEIKVENETNRQLNTVSKALLDEGKFDDLDGKSIRQLP